MSDTTIDTAIPILGKTSIPSPVHQTRRGEPGAGFISDTERVMIDVDRDTVRDRFEAMGQLPSFELAGPRKQIYFDPSKLKCALVTCGGLCPGLNDVIRAIVLELYYAYGVKNIYGVRYGLQGFIPEYGHTLLDLHPDVVNRILETGGSMLGSSRGPQSIQKIVDCLERMNIGILFMIGGDGTLMAATRISEVISQRRLKISVVGIPKTIDNDISLVSRSFGFDTAVDVATTAIKGAHKESEGYPNGIGLIKLMGRHSGFIAATATLAQQEVNFTLIPEVDFDLHGPGGLFPCIEARLNQRGHAVIVVAEGAGQKFFSNGHSGRDPSGNIKLYNIGVYLKSTINEYFQKTEMDVSLKYIDPSYMIRSLPANANDRVFCSALGRDAVHAGMAGKTDLLVGYWNDHFVHIPIQASAGKRKQVDPKGRLWLRVLEATGQGSLVNQTGGPGS